MQIGEKIMKEDVIFHCPIFRVAGGKVLLPDGKEAARYRVLHTGGCGVLPLTSQGEVLLVEQYRYGIGQTTLEIPAGKLEPGEDPAECALRELKEEVGATTERLTELGTIAVTPAYDSEIIYIYMAQCYEFTTQKLDEDEFLRVHKMPMEQAVEMVLSGQITDAKTQIALLKASKLLKNG